MAKTDVQDKVAAPSVAPVAEVKAVSSPAVRQDTARNPIVRDVNEPPAVEDTVTIPEPPKIEPKVEEKEEPFHNHPRFKELIDQKNEMLKKIQDLESKVNTATTRTEEKKAISAREKLVDKYVSKYGHTKEAAEEIVSDIDAIVTEQVAPLYQKELVNKVDGMIASFKNGKTDYDALEPVMLEILNSFSIEERQMWANNKNVLEMLYATAKERAGKSTVQTPAPAVIEPSKTGSISGKPAGVSSGTGWTREKIRNLSTTDFAAHQEEIETAYRNGEITE